MRTVLITGANRGIGRAIAEKALNDGNRLSLGIRHNSEIKGTILDPKVSGRERILWNKYDALDINSSKNFIQNTISEYGSFDSIIHCAGIFKRTNFDFNDDELKDISNLLNTNLMGPWHLTKEAWPELCKTQTSRIIVLVSMSGKRVKGNLAGYAVSKFALMGLCQAIRNEGWEKGVRVTAICPGWVNTDMANQISSLPKEMMTQAEDIAVLVSDLLKLPNSCIPFEIGINCNIEK